MFKTLFTRLPFCSLKQSLIDASLKHVNVYGWNQTAIAAACNDLGISPASQGILDKYQLISEVMDRWHNHSLKHLDDWNFDGVKGIKNKVALAIKIRLSQEIPYLSTWNQAMSVGARPSNALSTQKRLWRFADQVWIRCGDTSTDYNHYTKRFLFQSVYVSTQLFMLTDKSKDYQATWQFMDRRLNDILKVGKVTNSFANIVGAMMSGLVTSVKGVVQGYPPEVEHPMNKDQFHQEFQSERQQEIRQSRQDQEFKNQSK